MELFKFYRIGDFINNPASKTDFEILEFGKLAEPEVDDVHERNASLRVPLGKIALATITTKLKSVQEDLDAGKELAESVVF
jgi:hypothetical protein